VISRTPVVLVLTGALWGCDPAEPSALLVRAEPAVGRDRAPAAIERSAGVASRRGRLLAGERVERVPVWPAASTIAAVRERLSATMTAAIDRSPVPVLVPREPSWLVRASVHAVGPESPGYALAASQGGRHLSVQASRIATLLPRVGHVRGTRRIRGVDGFLGENEGIRTASWIEHGVAYSAELECEDPAGPDCREGQLEALVEGLVYVGGADAVGGAP